MILINNNKYFKTKSKRTSKFLYSLGFDKNSCFDENGNEYWLYKRSNALNEALDFYFSFRKKQLLAGDYDNEKRNIFEIKNKRS